MFLKNDFSTYCGTCELHSTVIKMDAQWTTNLLPAQRLSPSAFDTQAIFL